MLIVTILLEFLGVFISGYLPDIKTYLGYHSLCANYEFICYEFTTIDGISGLSDM